MSYKYKLRNQSFVKSDLSASKKLCFDTIKSSSSLSDSTSLNSVYDDLVIHIPRIVKRKIMKGKFVEPHTLLNEHAYFETQKS